MGPIIGLLLAAGQGRRFGSDKLLHPLVARIVNAYEARAAPTDELS